MKVFCEKIVFLFCVCAYSHAKLTGQNQVLTEDEMRAQGDRVVPDPAPPDAQIGSIRHYRSNTVQSLKNWAVATGAYKTVKDVPKSLKPGHYFRRYRVQAPEDTSNRRRVAADTTNTDPMEDREGQKASTE